MPGKQAKILAENDAMALLAYAETTRHPARNWLIVLLSTKAGLRAGEIANLTWDMVLDPSGRIGAAIELHDNAAKNRGGRMIPINADLRRALSAVRDGSEV